MHIAADEQHDRGLAPCRQLCEEVKAAKDFGRIQIKRGKGATHDKIEKGCESLSNKSTGEAETYMNHQSTHPLSLFVSEGLTSLV